VRGVSAGTDATLSNNFFVSHCVCDLRLTSSTKTKKVLAFVFFFFSRKRDLRKKSLECDAASVSMQNWNEGRGSEHLIIGNAC
jgi:hypothetical protein